MENLCLIMVHCDTDPKALDRELRELYSPQIEICYVRISQRFNPLQRALILRKVRKVFTKIELHIKPVSDYSIHLLNTFICWHQNLAKEVANSLNIFGKVLYRLWLRCRSSHKEHTA